METSGHDCVPINLYLYKQVVGQTCPRGLGFATVGSKLPRPSNTCANPPAGALLTLGAREPRIEIPNNHLAYRPRPSPFQTLLLAGAPAPEVCRTPWVASFPSSLSVFFLSLSPPDTWVSGSHQVEGDVGAGPSGWEGWEGDGEAGWALLLPVGTVGTWLSLGRSGGTFHNSPRPTIHRRSAQSLRAPAPW